MTRFARAKGSKSSNERAPEDSTPWEVMKEQLFQAKKQTEEAKKREEAEKQRIANYENFLKEHKTQKRKATWCDFPEAEKLKSVDSNVMVDSPTKKKKKNKQRLNEEQQEQATKPVVALNMKNQKKIKLNKQKFNDSSTGELKNSTLHKSNETVKEEITSISQKKKLKKQKKTDQTSNEPTVQALNNKTVEYNTTPVSPKKKIKTLYDKKEISDESLQASQLQNDDHNEETDLSSSKKTKNKKNGRLEIKGHENNNFVYNNKQMQSNKQKKSKKDVKLVDGKPIRRKPINDRSFQLIINGKEVELIRFDGFPIMKKDAERLEELKTNMIKKGIPKSEVNRTLKLERRRAEKALARLKRDVCYNCRKGGHNLSDCPELKTKIPGMGAPEGVCFKCGSTEHRQFECKVQRDKEFRFATCFICKEPGHIARQCPDNPKGLYPNGGGCKLCGDVTHLRKDCPTTMGQREETSIKLQTLDSTNTLEGIEQKTNTVPQETTRKPKKIKF